MIATHIAPTAGTGLLGNPLTPLLGPAAGAGSALARDTVSSVLNGLVSYLADGAQGVVRQAVGLLGRSNPDLTRTWFAGHVAAMVALAGVLLLPMLAAATIGAVLRQDMGRLARTWAVYLPVAILGGSLAVPLTAEGMRVTDAMSSVVTHDLGTDLTGALTRVGSLVVASVTSGAGAFVAALMAIVVVTGGLFIWMELLLRSAAIYIAVFFLPLALAGLVWPATSHWARHCVHLLAALLLSKFVIVGALMVGAGALSAAGPGPSNQALMGGAIMLLAAFAPFVLLRLAPIVESAAIAHLEGVSHRPFQALRSGATTASYAAGSPMVAALLSSRSTVGEVPAETPVAPRDLASIGNEVDLAFERIAGGDAPEGSGGGGEP